MDLPKGLCVPQDASFLTSLESSGDFLSSGTEDWHDLTKCDSEHWHTISLNVLTEMPDVEDNSVQQQPEPGFVIPTLHIETLDKTHRAEVDRESENAAVSTVRKRHSELELVRPQLSTLRGERHRDDNSDSTQQGTSTKRASSNRESAKIRERNRIAAAKFRSKKQRMFGSMEALLAKQEIDNANLKSDIMSLRNELTTLRTMVLAHNKTQESCGCALLHEYNQLMTMRPVLNSLGQFS